MISIYVDYQIYMLQPLIVLTNNTDKKKLVDSSNKHLLNTNVIEVVSLGTSKKKFAYYHKIHIQTKILTQRMKYYL